MKNVPNQQNQSQIIRMRWLKRFCQLDMLILLFEISIAAISQFYDISWMNIRVTLTFVLVIMLTTISFFMIRQPLIIFDEEVVIKSEKYERSGLGADTSNYYKNKLQTYMIEQQLFLNCDLTLTSLATTLGMTPHNLSQLLNESFETTFYDYLNHLRVEFAKELLLKKDQSIIDIAVDSGFNTKASFYNAFKKEVGCPPGQWRKTNKA